MTEEILNKAHDYARNHVEKTEEGGYDIIEEMRLVDAYLAGAKENAPQWHYPSKGDIPVESDEYLVIAESDHTLYKCLESYDPDDNGWSTCWRIIAWKSIDLPKEILEWTDNKE